MATSLVSSMMRFVRLIIINIAVLVLILIVIEGGSSILLLANDLSKTYLVAERKYTQYDPELGWVSKKNVYIPDLYGPGVYLETNTQGFRNNINFSDHVPEGKIRIICTGDSFTLGYGVSNDNTWCQLLSKIDTGIETLNMGQGGYGIDQAYLWYKRDATGFSHQIQLLSFITADVHRMQRDTFVGYGKPVLNVVNDKLVVNNVPVPRVGYTLSWLNTNKKNFERLRLFDFSKSVNRKMGSIATRKVNHSEDDKNEETRDVLHRLFADLKHINTLRGSQLVLVYFPTQFELTGQNQHEWLEFVENESRILRIPFINIVAEFRNLDKYDAYEMFIPKGKMVYPGAAGHFNEAGNKFVAKRIYEALKTHPATSGILLSRNQPDTYAGRP